MDGDPTFLGTVQDVHGVTVGVSLADDTISGLTFVGGAAYRVGQVGAFVRIPAGYGDLFGIVSQVGAGAVPERLADSEPFGNRWMTVELVGALSGRGYFERGVSQHPTIGDAVHLVTESGLAEVYGRPDEPQYVKIGTLASAESVPALVDINRLVTRHSAILGSTGSGKSTTVLGILSALCDASRYPSGRALVLDLHGEYATALRDRAVVFRVNPDTGRSEEPLHVPYWAMTFDELVPILFGTLSDSDRGYVLEKITDMKREALAITGRPGMTMDAVTVDSPLPFSVHKLWFDLHCDVNATHTTPPSGDQNESTWAIAIDRDGNPIQPGDPSRVIPPRFRGTRNVSGDADKVYLSNSRLQMGRQIDALAARLRDPRYAFLFQPGPWRPGEDGSITEDLDHLFSRWIGGQVPVAVLDLSGIPPSIVGQLVGVVLRIVYDCLFWARNLAEGARERPLLIVMEEAHAYLSPEATGGGLSAARQIVREGRKYGVGALIVSQRPSEIDPSVLSQCGTMVALRLGNAVDRAHVSSIAAENMAGILGLLPILRTGEAIVVGEAVHLPTRVRVTSPLPGQTLESDDPLVYNADYPGGWNNPRGNHDNYEEVVRVWRAQDSRSPRAVDTSDAETSEGNGTDSG